VIPDKVIVLTTETGRERIAKQLFGEDEVWQDLRRTLLGKGHEHDPRLDFDCTPDRVKVFHRRQGPRRIPLHELASMEDNKAVADCLVDELWTHTSRPDTRVIASLAGGYKTMAALCLSAMQLLANPGDRVTHVLVGGGYEQARPLFFFPEQKEQILEGSAGPVKASDAAARIQLIDVPVIPLRQWFEETLSVKPPSYEILLTQSTATLAGMRTKDLRLEIGPLVLQHRSDKHEIKVNGQPTTVTLLNYALLRYFSERALNGQSEQERLADICEDYAEWIKQAGKREARFMRLSEKADGFDEESLSKRMSDLRSELKKASPAIGRLALVLPGKGCWKLELPKEAITLR